MAFKTKGDPLDVSARSYATQLRCEAAARGITLPLTDDTDWDQIFCAEADLIRVLPEPDLKRRAQLVYERYAEVAGPTKAAARVTNALDLTKCTLDELRADLLAFHNETARMYLLGYQVERERADLARFVFYIGFGALATFVIFISWAFLVQYMSEAAATAIVAGLAVALVAALWRYEKYRTSKQRLKVSAAALLLVAFLAAPPVVAQTTATTTTATTTASAKLPPASGRGKTASTASKASQKPSANAVVHMPIAPLVILTGVLGACFSVLQRVQRPMAGDPLLALLSLRGARTQIFLSIISGAIASLVVFAVFTGGMISGALFPNIVNHLKPKSGMLPLYDFLRATGPATYVDYGKLLVWAFIAGFAERFVPDILDRFVTTAKK